MEAAYSIVQKDNEYRVLLTSVNIEVLPERIHKILISRNIDISELMIERISGDSTVNAMHKKIWARSEPKSCITWGLANLTACLSPCDVQQG